MFLDFLPASEVLEGRLHMISDFLPGLFRQPRNAFSHPNGFAQFFGLFQIRFRHLRARFRPESFQFRERLGQRFFWFCRVAYRRPL